MQEKNADMPLDKASMLLRTPMNVDLWPGNAVGERGKII